MSKPHFETADSWKAAREMVAFEPRLAKDSAGRRLESIRIHGRDHRQRELGVDGGTLEAHYGAFVLSQSCRGVEEARRLALETSYGREAREARIAGHEARVYELGPEPEAGDIDGRSPAVVTWCDSDTFFLIASSERPFAALIPIAWSLY